MKTLNQPRVVRQRRRKTFRAINRSPGARAMDRFLGLKIVRVKRMDKRLQQARQEIVPDLEDESDLFWARQVLF